MSSVSGYNTYSSVYNSGNYEQYTEAFETFEEEELILDNEAPNSSEKENLVRDKHSSYKSSSSWLTSTPPLSSCSSLYNSVKNKLTACLRVRSHYKKGKEHDTHELEGTRLYEIIHALSNIFEKSTTGITNIIALYDDPSLDIVKKLKQGNDLPEQLKVLANDVKKLNLVKFKHILAEFHIFRELISSFANVESLNLPPITNKVTLYIIPRYFEKLIQLQQLQKLNLVENVNITEDDLSDIAKLKNLRALNLRGCNQITDPGLAHLAELEHLEYLNLDGCSLITDTGLAHISTLKNLRYLNLDNCENFTEVGYRYLNKLKNLQYLIINANESDRAFLNIDEHGKKKSDTNELEGTRLYEITQAVSNIFKTSSITDIIALYDDPCADVVMKLKHGNDLPEQLKVLANSVKKLDISQFQDELSKFDIFRELMSSFTNLESLDLPTITNKVTLSAIPEFSKEFLKIPDLQELNLAGNINIDDDGLDDIAKLKKLRVLNLSGCNQITDKGLIHIAKLEHLESLNLDGCYITDIGLVHISTLKNLRYLNLDNCEDFTEIGYRHLNKLKNLQYIIINANESDRAFLNIDEHGKKREGNELEGTRFYEINKAVSDALKISDIGIASIIAVYDNPYADIMRKLKQGNSLPEPLKVVASHVEKLNLLRYGEELAKFDMFQEFISLFKNIKSLNIPPIKNKVSRFDFNTLLNISDLQELDLAGIENIIDDNLNDIAKLKKLRILNLSGCEEITDAGLANLAGLEHLESLNLRGCNQITDAGLANIARLEHLESLNLDGCNEITDDGLAKITTLKELRYLNLDNCEKITVTGHDHISEFKNIQHLIVKAEKIDNASKLLTITSLHHLEFSGHWNDLDLAQKDIYGQELNDNDSAHLIELMFGIRSLEDDAGIDFMFRLGCPDEEAAKAFMEEFKIKTHFKSVKIVNQGNKKTILEFSI